MLRGITDIVCSWSEQIVLASTEIRLTIQAHEYYGFYGLSAYIMLEGYEKTKTRWLFRVSTHKEYYPNTNRE